jgi:hypothetical protein
MVHALREAQRVLTPSGVLIDVRPVTAPIVVEVIISTRTAWAKTVESYSAAEDNAAADSAIHLAVSREWLVFETSVPFDFEIYCDVAAELRAYVETRKLRGAQIPYDELEERRRGFDAQGARLRCRRPWKLSTYRKKTAARSVRAAESGLL